MKKKLKIVVTMHLFLGLFVNYAQIKPSCKPSGERIEWNSDIFKGFDAHRCDNDVAIIATTRDIKVKNYIKVQKHRKLLFKPTGTHRIQILPEEKVKEKEDGTPWLPDDDGWGGIGDRTDIGTSSPGADGRPSLTLSLHPNPTTTELQVTSNKEIMGYQVVDFYGVIHLEGTNLLNNTLSVSTLPPGTYFLLIQTEAGTIAKHFIKN